MSDERQETVSDIVREMRIGDLCIKCAREIFPERKESEVHDEEKGK